MMDQQRGQYFRKKEYSDEPILSFEDARPSIPEPIIETKLKEIESYWRAWEIAYNNVYSPTKESNYVSNFVDAAFNDDIFMWDTAFITMFCNIAHPYIPGIRSLDNFYCKQLEDGEIPREIVRETGEDFWRWTNPERKPLYSFFHNSYKHGGIIHKLDKVNFDEVYFPELGRNIDNSPYLTLDNLNHPIMAWAELESFYHTGDVERLELVWEPLLKYYHAMRYHLYNNYGLFVTDWASMDNSPRNRYLGSGIDISCEMVLFARHLIEISRHLSNNNKGSKIKKDTIDELESDSKKFTEAINQKMWNQESGFYYDITNDGKQSPIKTIAAFWSLLGEVADDEQAKRLVEWIKDPNTFNRIHGVPTLAADEEDYDPMGGYWQGAVWAPTNTMVIRGLEKYGYDDVAKEIAINHLENVVKVYENTGTFWENYAPDSVEPGEPSNGEFVGWTGIAPILYLFEYRLGIKANAMKNEVNWNIDTSLGKSGCNRYWFNGKTINLLASPQSDGTVQIDAESDGEITLNVNIAGRKKCLHLNGKQTLTV